MAEKYQLEEAMERLDEIASILSAGDATLDQALELYAEASKLIAFCEKKLNAAQAKVEKLLAVVPKAEETAAEGTADEE